MTNLFSERSQDETMNSARQLAKTAELSTLAATLVNSAMETIKKDQSTFESAVIASQTSHEEMDSLIKRLNILSDVDVEFLKEEDQETLEKMLRSQQSKRSRAKGKTMTMENYKSMMNAAICELLLRSCLGTPKSTTKLGESRATIVEYSDEELQELAADQEALGREIRNIQSKKSIAKSKIGFDENSERWQSLLRAEIALKSLRIGGTRTVKVTDNKSTEIKAMLSDVDINALKATDAKALLDKINSLLNKAAE